MEDSSFWGDVSLGPELGAELLDAAVSLDAELGAELLDGAVSVDAELGAELLGAAAVPMRTCPSTKTPLCNCSTPVSSLFLLEKPKAGPGRKETTVTKLWEVCIYIYLYIYYIYYIKFNFYYIYVVYIFLHLPCFLFSENCGNMFAICPSVRNPTCYIDLYCFKLGFEMAIETRLQAEIFAAKIK